MAKPDVIDTLSELGIPWDHTGDPENSYLIVDVRNELPEEFKQAFKIDGQAILGFSTKQLGRRTPPKP